ncbi:MAG: hypothetical protein ACJA1N_002533 [Saprospiraceae bacterium]|jgi:hypothetical protein
MMLKNYLQKYGLLITIVLQMILLIIGFNKAFSRAGDYMFLNIFDGFKNYFTFQSYLSQPKGDLLKFTQMNYPYGEYIFYTDNSPAIALPLKFISDNIIDLTAIGVPLYNFILIFGYLLTTVFTYLILKKHLQTGWLIILFSICLSWIHPQILRPFVGHLNLGWAWVLLFAMYATQKIMDADSDKNRTQKWLIGLTLMLIWSAFIHLYYLLINVTFLGFWAVAWAIDNYWKKENWWKPLLKGIVPGVIALAITMIIIRLVDTEYANRLAAKGYNFQDWKLYIPSLFHSYEHNTMYFPFRAIKSINYESYSYLGSFALFGILGFLIIRILKRSDWIKSFIGKLKIDKNRILYYWLFAAIMMSFIALGNEIHTSNYKIYNYLSLFYYVNQVTEMTTHFRCLGRFSWFLFWAVNFIFAFIIDQIFINSNKRYFKIIAIVLIGLLILDAKDFLIHFNKIERANQLTHQANFPEIIELTKDLNSSEYQAILPIPYFHTGSEDFHFTLDAPAMWLNRCGQFQQATNLPLIASQMSRTAYYQPQELFSIFTDSIPNQNLLDRFNDKPILVFYSKFLNEKDDKWIKNKREPSFTVATKGKAIIEKYDMVLVKETKDFVVYRWNIGKLK